MFRPPADSIIFDLDGTLWDASPTSAIAWSKVAANLGIDVSIDESSIKKVSGLPFDKCVDVLFGSHAQKIPDLKSLLDESERDEVLHRGGRFYDGMLDGLRELSKGISSFLSAIARTGTSTLFLNIPVFEMFFKIRFVLVRQIARRVKTLRRS
ncbi:MAG: HAD family hydrolase [Bdellovibrionaceae bacterium]|nr:HAD family hydrolase [Pseudobdellovibrionaceae bacterium]